MEATKGTLVRIVDVTAVTFRTKGTLETPQGPVEIIHKLTQETLATLDTRSAKKAAKKGGWREVLLAAADHGVATAGVPTADPRTPRLRTNTKIYWYIPTTGAVSVTPSNIKATHLYVFEQRLDLEKGYIEAYHNEETAILTTKTGQEATVILNEADSDTITRTLLTISVA